MSLEAATHSLGLYAQRTVRILTRPWPINFGERLAILRTLERHGSFEVFREESQTQPEFIGVVKNEATVDELFKKNPMVLRVPVPKDIRHREHPNAQSSSLEVPLEQQAVSQDAPDQETASLDKKEFVIEVYPSHSWDHAMASEKNPFTGSWPMRVTNSTTFSTNALKQAVPKGLTSSALAYWDAGNAQRERGSLQERLRLAAFVPLRMDEMPGEDDQLLEDNESEGLPQGFALQRQGVAQTRSRSRRRAPREGHEKRQRRWQRRMQARAESVEEEEEDELTKQMRVGRNGG